MDREKKIIKIYDCFTFFDEMDLLELRFSILEKVVDFFVIVESNYTFSGKPKPYNFQNCSQRYKKWLSHIIYLPITQNPANYFFNPKIEEFSIADGAWQMEFQQRNMISFIRNRVNDNDLILIGDVDEVPNPNLVKKMKLPDCPVVFRMAFHYYYLNCKNVGKEPWWNGTIALSGEQFQLFDPQTIRNNRFDYKAVENAGWHFSYLGGIQQIRKKIISFAHRELNMSHLVEENFIAQRVKNAEDIFYRPGMIFQYQSIRSYPWFIQKMMLRFPSLVRFPRGQYFFLHYSFRLLSTILVFVKKSAQQILHK